MESELDILRQYIRNETGYGGELGEDQDLLETQVLDSFNIVIMALFVQERFGIVLEAEELVRENLSKLSSMVTLIRAKRAAAS
jgi:acyl carrier protein